jgi:hypothetical protein
MSSPTNRRRSGSAKLSHGGRGLVATRGASCASCASGAPSLGSALDAPLDSSPPFDICVLIVRPSLQDLSLPKVTHECGEGAQALKAER